MATFVMNASIVADDPRMIVGVAQHHFTHELIMASGVMALHLAGTDDIDAVVHFGLQSGHHAAKFPWQGVTGDDGGPPALLSCAGRLTAEVESQLDIGDRTLFVCRIIDGGPATGAEPMTMSQLIPQLNAEQLQTLQQRLQEDSAKDRLAIQQWRQQSGIDHSA